MLRTVHFEHLRPGELVEEKKRFPVVYLPIGPLEWHGPHLALGMDPLNAAAISERVAQRVGGVVLPTFYWGTERERSPEMLEHIGFDRDDWVVGMDFPKNSMKSLYINEDAFGVAVREYLRVLVEQEYKLIVIINGHGGENHIRTLERLAAEFTATTPAKVMYTITTFLPEGEQDFGHATRVETSILTALHPECVDLGTLPEKGTVLHNQDFAIVDDLTFRGFPTPEYTVRDDPREASRELGEKTLAFSVDTISKMVTDAYQQLDK
nr:creatininase family protein [bacterium]